MDYRDVDPRFTADGRLRLQAAELDTLQELVDAGDRGAFHFLYGELANNSDSRLTAKISTFSDIVGGTAFAANWALQITEPSYAGIYQISQKIAADNLLLVREDAESADGGTGFLTVDEHFASAEATWASYGLLDLFPGNLINLIRNEPQLTFLEELADIAAFLTGGASEGERAGLFGAMYSGYAGKKLSDFEGQAGYQILDVAGGKVVIDSDGRTIATFIDAPTDDFLAAAAQGFTLGAAWETFADSPGILYELMGQVGDPNAISSPYLSDYVAARRDFTQYSNGAYNGDNNPGSYPAVGNPTISISQTATGDRDLLVFGNAADDVTAGGGEDFVVGGTGNDTVRGNEGDDVLWGQIGSDYLDGGDGNDILRGGIASDALYGGAGDDVIDGADISIESYEPLAADPDFNNRLLGGFDGHDLILGGSGNDLIRAGHGADIIFDSGLDAFESESLDISPDNTALYAYDGGDDGNGGVAGSDTIIGGHGSDLMVYTGGADTFVGGQGDDTYLISPDFLSNRTNDDKLTITLSEDASDESTWFGHDYVVGNGAGIHEIVFEGLNRDDVTFTYEYTETHFDELDGATQTMFLNLFGIDELDLGTYPIFSLSGALTITVNSTGSSIYFDNVTGAYVGGDNNPGGNIYVEPIIFTQTYAVFEDATYFDWARQVGLENFIKPINGTISDDADDAPESQSSERGDASAIPAYEQTGTGDMDFLIGDQLGDHLRGFAGDDYIHGFDGDDVLEGGEGGDFLHGGDGIDIASYQASTAAVAVSLGSGSASGGEAEGDLLVSIEGLRGSAFDDTFNGDNEESINILEGGAGNDRLVTGWGDYDSFLYGGAGDDDLIVRSGAALLDGGDGNDELFGHSGNDVNYGGAGDDELTLTEGNDYYDGGDGFDILTNEFTFATFDTNYINLTEGVAIDQSIGTSSPGIGVNQLVSIEGYRGGRGDDLVTGTDGANILSGSFGEDQLFGLAGNDTLDGGYQDDLIEGGDGDDGMTGGGGNDTIRGGDGTDTASYSGAFAGYSFSTQGQILYVTETSSGDADQISDDVELVSFGDGTYTWSELSGITVNEAPVANPDVASVTEGELVAVDPRLNDSDANGDPLTVISVNGNAITPSTTIYTGPGLSLTIRMTAAGVLTFEADDPFGGDLAPGETQEFVLDYELSDGVGGTDTSTITLTVVGKDEGSDGIVTGTSGADTIDGAFVDADGDTVDDTGQVIEALEGDDRIYDGAGDDTVSGGEGRDRFYAGAGADTYDGGAATNDEVIYSTSSVGLTIDMSNPSASTGIAAGDTYTGVERMQGTNHDDILIAGSGITVLNARNGDDTLYDDAARNTLRGGNGADTFVLMGGDGQQDRISDFVIGVDVIDLSGWGVEDFADLTITERVNGQGVPTGGLIVDFGPESLRLDGFTGADIASFSAADFVFSTGGGPLPWDGIVTGTAGNDTINAKYTDSDGDVVNNSGQRIEGLDGDDKIYDGSGDDTILGGDGRDRFYDGGGADAFDGGADTRDEVIYTKAGAGVTVDMGDVSNNTGNAAGDTYTGIERLQGSKHDDVLIAGGAVTVLNGQAGDDILVDAAGKESLRGSSGADTFVFGAGDGQQDRIYDFELGIDRIDISAWGATGVGDLTIEERTNSSGAPKGDLIVSFGAESLRIDDYAAADIASFDNSQFIFA